MFRNLPRAFCAAVSTVIVVGCGSSSSSDIWTEPADGGGGGAGVLIVPAEGGACSGDACVCRPGVETCSGGQARLCSSDGTAWIDYACDPVQGMQCQADGCKGACALAELGPSYIGCDYFPTVTLNAVWSGFPFAVAVANTASSPANVTVTRGGQTILKRTVQASSIDILGLDWVADLKGGDVDGCQIPPPPGVTRVVKDGAYRLRSDAPVTVYQYSPLTYEISPAPAECPMTCPGGVAGLGCKAYSADASLLLPSNAFTGNYRALTWPSTKDRAGFLAITASADDTHVTLDGRGTFAAGAGIDGAGVGEVVLATGDVLEVLADTPADAKAFGSDITGTRVHASRPVQVIAGHSCANVPLADTGYCDHLEETLFPIETLGSEYLVTYPGVVAGESPHVVRILAVADQTHVSFDPDVSPATTIGPADPVVEIAGMHDFKVKADKPIIVAQYMQGSQSLDVQKVGDPSLSLAIPTAQFRSHYVFVASGTYQSNFVNIIAPAGATITLDGAAIPASELTAIGGSGYGVARHQLSQSDRHTIDGAPPFGIVVYGYGKDTSYMYPGGLDLKHIADDYVR